jgi:putative YpdA family bacillithiol system oxidoreductase
MYDLIIVGAGPAGLSACYEAKERGLEYLGLERNTVANTLETYPHGKDIHYYPANVDVMGHLPLPEGKAEDTLRAWQEFAKELNIKEKEEVEEIKKEGETFKVITCNGQYESKFILIAIGVQGTVRKIPIDCDDEKHVCYKIPEPKDYHGKKVIVVGGGDTAIEHALLLRDAGATVTLSYRKPEFFRLKDVNREAIDASDIQVIFNSNVKCIKGGKAVVDISGETKEIEADAIAIFAGTIPATDFLEKIGLELENNKPKYDPETLESNIPRMFIAGDLTKQPLIKPAINHGVQIVDEIAGRLSK